MKEPTISVIIPVFNVEKYISRTIDSVISQSYLDWELVLVDDGSTDNSGTICDSFAAANPKIKVVHQKNSGVSVARNRGIMESNGRYCCFVDSDDWIEPTYLSNFLVPNFTDYGCVLQSFYVDEESSSESKLHLLPQSIIKTSAELVCFLETTKGVHNGFLWHRLFDLKLIKKHDLGFPPGVSFAEDGVFFLNYLLYTDNFYISEKAGYHYIIRSGSLTSKGKKQSRSTYYSLLENYVDTIEKLIKKDSPDTEKIDALRLYIRRLVYSWLLVRCMNNKSDYYSNALFIKDHLSNTDFSISKLYVPCVYNAIFRLLKTEPSDTRYLILVFLLRLYDFEVRLKNKFINRK